MSDNNNSLTDGLKKILLAGVGAATVVVEKTGEVVDKLVEKGELTMEQGKTLSEELKRSFEEKTTEAEKKLTEQEMHSLLESLTPEERAHLKAKLEEMDQKQAE